jgi:hypothetical protein
MPPTPRQRHCDFSRFSLFSCFRFHADAFTIMPPPPPLRRRHAQA